MLARRAFERPTNQAPGRPAAVSSASVAGSAKRTAPGRAPMRLLPAVASNEQALRCCSQGEHEIHKAFIGSSGALFSLQASPRSCSGLGKEPRMRASLRSSGTALQAAPLTHTSGRRAEHNICGPVASITTTSPLVPVLPPVPFLESTPEPGCGFSATAAGGTPRRAAERP